MTAPTRIFLVDDHPMVREGLANMLQGAGFQITGQVEGVHEALRHPALPESELVIVDLALGEESGIELIKRLKERGLATLVYSMHECPDVIRKALDAGAGGYVTKREASGSLNEAVHAVQAGRPFLSPRAKKALARTLPVDTLTGQQQLIYRLMGQGLSNDEIARQLKISVRTLESYCVRIMDKLTVQGIKELRRQAIRDATTTPSV
ncbi:MAG: response regulator transcription factor [Spartobacteria bacterium]|nr:response regulator transcription factor [Spartobacteria bacterium]